MFQLQVLMDCPHSDLFRHFSGSLNAVVSAKVKRSFNEGEIIQELQNSNYDLVVICHLQFSSTLLEWMRKMNPLMGIIIVGPETNVQRAIEVMKAGADDFLLDPLATEPFQQAVLRCMNKKKVLKTKEGQLNHSLVYVDDVTGLYNSRSLNCVLDHEISLGLTEQRTFAVLFIDVDRFKRVNDRYGHEIGTQLLCELADHLKEHAGLNDRIFRYGGDEFVMVLSLCDLDEAEAFAFKITHSVGSHRFLRAEKLEIQCEISVGISVFPGDSVNKSGLLRLADRDMYRVKKRLGSRLPSFEDTSPPRGSQGYRYG